MVKLQTLDAEGQVLEQSAFSELQMDAPVRMDRLTQMMGRTEGYRVEKVNLTKTSPAAEGWTLKSPVAGFNPVSCFKRPAAATPARDGAMQWVFSDGLAAVSLFVEMYDPQRHLQETNHSAGRHPNPDAPPEPEERRQNQRLVADRCGRGAAADLAGVCPKPGTYKITV